MGTSALTHLPSENVSRVGSSDTHRRGTSCSENSRQLGTSKVALRSSPSSSQSRSKNRPQASSRSAPVRRAPEIVTSSFFKSWVAESWTGITSALTASPIINCDNISTASNPATILFTSSSLWTIEILARSSALCGRVVAVPQLNRPVHSHKMRFFLSLINSVEVWNLGQKSSH